MKPNIQIWAVGRLIPYAQNVKLHKPEQVAKIAKSIRDFGWTQPIVVDETGVIIAGHGRRLAALSLNITEVPVWVRDDLTEDQIKALRLADNRVAQGDIDTEMFRAELADMSYDLTGIFDDKELDFGTSDLGEFSSDLFIEDVNGAVSDQKEETKRHIEETAARLVPIGKALGFKTVSGADEIHISRFMALVAAQYGGDPASAFVQFVKSIGETA